MTKNGPGIRKSFEAVFLVAIVLGSLGFNGKLAASDFPIVMYDNFIMADDAYKDHLNAIKLMGCNTVLTYSRGQSPANCKKYLDYAASIDLKVILEIWRPLYHNNQLDPLTGAGYNWLLDWYFNAILADASITEHSALAGWYVGDEIVRVCDEETNMDAWDALVSQMEYVYSQIKSVSDKNVFIAICRYSSISLLDDLADSVDIILFDRYPMQEGMAEFDGNGNEEFPLTWDFWKMHENNFEYWFVGQADGGGNFDLRLPTLDEHRYMTFTSICQYADGPTGYAGWAYYQLLGITAEEDVMTGVEWIEAVWNPVVDQLKAAANALGAGSILGSSNPNTYEPWKWQVYQDQNNANHYLMASHYATSSGTSAFDLSDLEYTSYKAFNMETEDVVSINSNSLADSFTQYGAKMYKIGVSLSPNPHFRSDLSNWTAESCTATRTIASPRNSGWRNTTGASCRVDNRNHHYDSIYGTLDVSQMTAQGVGTYGIRFYFSMDDPSETMRCSVKLLVDGVWEQDIWFQASVSNSNWHLIENTGSLNWSTPPTAARIYFYPSGLSSFYIDDVEIYKLHNPTPTVILNEYNAVEDAVFLNGGDLNSDDATGAASDAYFGRVAGNGGDWFELIVLGNGNAGSTDLRGYQIQVGRLRSDGSFDALSTLVLSDDHRWSSVENGTILSFIEDNTANGGLDTAVKIVNKLSSDGWIWTNVWIGDTTLLTYTDEATNGYDLSALPRVNGLSIDDLDTQFRILDATDQIVFDATGEGVAPVSGVSGNDVFELRKHPSLSITPLDDAQTDPDGLGYSKDSSGSSFGRPNTWQLSRSTSLISQDFSAFISETVAPYDIWTASYGLSGDAVLPNTDSDLDGFTNLEEYLFAGNPTVATDTPTIIFDALTRNRITATVRNDDSNYTISPEWSRDLENWYSSDFTLTAANASVENGYSDRSWVNTLSGEPKLFYRLKVK